MKKNEKGHPVESKGRPLADTLRRPVVHPGHPLNRAKPEERAHPAERKIKHKRRADDSE
jgi:hypothetical protein